MKKIKKKAVNLLFEPDLKLELMRRLETLGAKGINAQQWGRRLARATVDGRLDELLVDSEAEISDGHTVTLNGQAQVSQEMVGALLDRWGQKDGPLIQAVRQGGEFRDHYIAQLAAGTAALDPPPPKPRRPTSAYFEE